MGRGWSSAPGASLTFSLSLPIAREDWSGLSLAVGVALADALDPHGAADAAAAPGPEMAQRPLADGRPGARPQARRRADRDRLGRPRAPAVIGIGLNVRPLDEVDAGSGFACMQEIDARPTRRPCCTAWRCRWRALPRRFEAEGFAAFVADYARRDLLASHAVPPRSRA